MTGLSRANEQHPLLTPAVACDTMATTSSCAATTTAVLRYTSFRAVGGIGSSPASVAPSGHLLALQQQQQLKLSRKYIALPVDDVVAQKRTRSKPMPVPTTTATGYGTMALAIDVDDSDDDDVDVRDNNLHHRSPSDNQYYYSHSPAKGRAAGSSAALRSLLCKLDDPRKSASRIEMDHPSDASCSNQSETESDSDGSCGSNTNSSSSSSSTGSLQSILRIRDGVYACRKVKKQVSVEFRLDPTDREVEDIERRKLGALSCASSCMPRRLTIEEKAALYRVRPDLQLMPLPLLMRELDEIRRRRQRRLMFSALGGSLILLMMLVFYYLLAETP